MFSSFVLHFCCSYEKNSYQLSIPTIASSIAYLKELVVIVKVAALS